MSRFHVPHEFERLKEFGTPPSVFEQICARLGRLLAGQLEFRTPVMALPRDAKGLPVEPPCQLLGLTPASSICEGDTIIVAGDDHVVESADMVDGSVHLDLVGHAWPDRWSVTMDPSAGLEVA